MRIACVLDVDYEDSEFKQPYDAFKQAGHQVTIVGLEPGKELKGKKGTVTTRAEAGIDQVAQLLGIEHTSCVVHQIGLGVERSIPELLPVVLADQTPNLFSQHIDRGGGAWLHGSFRPCSPPACASHSRWSLARLPGCTAVASSSAPTSRSGLRSRA